MEIFKSGNEGNCVEYDVNRTVNRDEKFDPEAQVIQVGRDFKQPSSSF